MTYLDWISVIIFPDAERRSSYSKVINALYDTDFHWTIRGDINRVKDGLQLRAIYLDETGMEADKDGDVSVLEVLTALAMRCESQLMWDPDKGDRTDIWFWEMFSNLGLDSLEDMYWDEQEFRSIMWHFMDREYYSDGYGGPFYIRGFDQDMRKIELWYQLNYYLQCNFM